MSNTSLHFQPDNGPAKDDYFHVSPRSGTQREVSNSQPGRNSNGAKKNVLIVGGAGFIGSHLVDELIGCGHRVRILDNLSPQVHGSIDEFPEYLNNEADLFFGDVRDSEVVHRALDGIDVVFHFAAAVGVGQSMYEIQRYTSTNNSGTASLLEHLIHHPVERLILASSMSIYGEGLYQTVEGTIQTGMSRSLQQLKEGLWELRDVTGHALQPVPTPETKEPSLASIYALSKYAQEQMCLIFGRAYNVPTVALRFFNVYGTRQALSNPYTGVLAIFASYYLNDKPPLIFEDGLQRRDFVSVHDIVTACRLAMEATAAPDQVFNIGSGRSYTILEVAEAMAKVMGKEKLKPVLTGKYRMGDIRHCFANIERAQSILGYEPKVTLEEGLSELAEWLHGHIAFDGVDMAKSELERRGLTI